MKKRNRRILTGVLAGAVAIFGLNRACSDEPVQPKPRMSAEAPPEIAQSPTPTTQRLQTGTKSKVAAVAEDAGLKTTFEGELSGPVPKPIKDMTPREKGEYSAGLDSLVFCLDYEESHVRLVCYPQKENLWDDARSHAEEQAGVTVDKKTGEKQFNIAQARDFITRNLGKETDPCGYEYSNRNINFGDLEALIYDDLEPHEVDADTRNWYKVDFEDYIECLITKTENKWAASQLTDEERESMKECRRDNRSNFQATCGIITKQILDSEKRIDASTDDLIADLGIIQDKFLKPHPSDPNLPEIDFSHYKDAEDLFYDLLYTLDLCERLSFAEERQSSMDRIIGFGIDRLKELTFAQPELGEKSYFMISLLEFLRDRRLKVLGEE